MDAETLSFDDALAALAWQVDMGADEAILAEPVSRFRVKDTPAPAEAPPPEVQEESPVTEAQRLAAAACTLDALRETMAAFEGCELKKGARSLVFADGVPGARVMVIGEAPGRDEDRAGKPFVGRSGQLLDKMFGAIGLSRSAEDPAEALYITNVIPWRPVENRDPAEDEIAMLIPFLERHVDLARPEILVAMGNAACKALLGQTGITRLRGKWQEARGRPVLPMNHPAALLRGPERKALAWRDLLDLKSRMGA